MDIFEKVKNLNLPLGEYVVIGGGILEALGIRKTNDLDIIVTPKLLKELGKTGKYKEEIKWGKLFLIGDKIEIGSKLDWENYSTKLDKAIKTAVVINGIPFLNIEETIKFKKALNREKDLKDLVLIKNYQKEFKKLVKSLPYRKNVGALVFKGNKYLLISYAWQADSYWKMPQGGVNDNETKRKALMRELKEELGTDKFKILKQFPFSHQYDWDEATVKVPGNKFRGQKQTFFFVEFIGKDSEIKLDENELKDYCWVTKDELLKRVDNKHPMLKGYKKLVEKLLK